MTHEYLSRLSEPCPLPEGTRVRLVAMPNDPSPVEAGTFGTVRGGNGAQIWVAWDNGRSLSLIPGVDTYEVVRFHKAEPSPDLSIDPNCQKCGREVKRVPGGDGPVWVHAATGMVVGP